MPTPQLPTNPVHYVLADGPNAGQSRLAIASKIDSTGTILNLCVFIDGINDYPEGCAGATGSGKLLLRPLWVQNVHKSGTVNGAYPLGTWH